MRINVDIYYAVATKNKSLFKLKLTKAQYNTLATGIDLTIKGNFRLFKKREKVVFAPIFQVGENETKFIGVKLEEGRINRLPSYYIGY